MRYLMDIYHTMSETEWRALQITVAIVAGFFTILGVVSNFGFVWIAKAMGWLDARNDVKRDRLHEFYISCRPQGNGGYKFHIDTPKGVHPLLHDLIDDTAITAQVRKRLTRIEPGEPILPAGEDLAHVLDCVCAHVTGGDAAATVAALAGRHDEYVEAKIAAYLTRHATGFGTVVPAAFYMPRAILLDIAKNPSLLEKSRFARFKHERIKKVIRAMAEAYKASVALYADGKVHDEDTEHAAEVLSTVGHATLLGMKVTKVTVST